MGITVERIEDLTNRTITTTQKEIKSDLINYVKKNKHIKSATEYVQKRKQYLFKIWHTKWEQRLTSSFNRNEKQDYLVHQGVAPVPGKPSKINEKLISLCHPSKEFNPEEWVVEQYGTNEKWKVLKEEIEAHAMTVNKKREMERFTMSHFSPRLEKVIDKEWDELYLDFRDYLGRKLRKDIKNNHFSVQDATYVKDVWCDKVRKTDERNGYHASHVKRGDTYHKHYQKVAKEYIKHKYVKKLLALIPYDVKETYSSLFQKEMDEQYILEVYEFELQEIREEMMQLFHVERIENVLSHKNRPANERGTRRSKGRMREEERSKREQAEQRKRELLSYIFEEEYQAIEPNDTKYFLHLGEPNTGKTYQALQAMKTFESGIYLAPLRLLALEVYQRLNDEGIPCSLRTGEEERQVENAKHVACTVEMFQEKEYHDIVIIDEAQMIEDKERGFSWFRSITKAKGKEVHIIGSKTVENILKQLLEHMDCTVKYYERDTPLEVVTKPFHIEKVQKGDALVAFSRSRVLEIAAKLENDGKKVSVIYGNMPPDSRQKQMERFASGENEVVVATDAIGMGLNLPIKRIILMDSQKFDGVRRRLLTSQEIKQIAGRAGRKGMYDKGEVLFVQQGKVMKKALEREDQPIQKFTVAPTRTTLERFGEHYRELNFFFGLWDQFKAPKGTTKSTLVQEKHLYGLIEGTEIERNLDIYELYRFLQMPFSAFDQNLASQWKESLFAILYNKTIQDPIVKEGSLEELEHSYKSIELHLMFLYRLEKKTQAYYWEIIKKEVSEKINQWLAKNIKHHHKKCKQCQKKMSWDSQFGICQNCYEERYVHYDYY